MLKILRIIFISAALLAGSVTSFAADEPCYEIKAECLECLHELDAAISPGSSGGGLFDAEGNVIDILTSKYVGEDVEGIGFAIPADLALEF